MAGKPAEHGVSRSTQALATRSACALALALLKGDSVDAERFARELRTPSLEDGQPLRRSDVTAFDRALERLEEAGIAVTRGAKRHHAVRLSEGAAADLAPLAGREAVLENLAQILVAEAGASTHENAREAHLAAAKLTRDFVICGEPRLLPPTDNKIERTLRDALAMRERVLVRYEREDGEVVERTLEPVRHALHQGRDFLVAFEANDPEAQLKTYDYAGFLAARLTGERFTPREAPTGRLFSPPFAYVRGEDPPASTVRFGVSADRVEGAWASLERLLCCDYFSRETRPDGSEVWSAEGVSPSKAAAFAIRLGIEVLEPRAFRARYLDTIAAARRAFS